MNRPADLKYSAEHVWVRTEGSRAVIGMTDFAQEELGEIVFVELPKAGDSISVGQPFGNVESVKTVSELYAPISGKVVEINLSLEDSPEKVNHSPYNDGWMIIIEMEDASQLDLLWSADKYQATYGEN